MSSSSSAAAAADAKRVKDIARIFEKESEQHLRPSPSASASSSRSTSPSSHRGSIIDSSRSRGSSVYRAKVSPQQQSSSSHHFQSTPVFHSISSDAFSPAVGSDSVATFSFSISDPRFGLSSSSSSSLSSQSSSSSSNGNKPNNIRKNHEQSISAVLSSASSDEDDDEFDDQMESSFSPASADPIVLAENVASLEQRRDQVLVPSLRKLESECEALLRQLRDVESRRDRAISQLTQAERRIRRMRRRLRSSSSASNSSASSSTHSHNPSIAFAADEPSSAASQPASAVSFSADSNPQSSSSSVKFTRRSGTVFRVDRPNFSSSANTSSADDLASLSAAPSDDDDDEDSEMYHQHVRNQEELQKVQQQLLQQQNQMQEAVEQQPLHPELEHDSQSQSQLKVDDNVHDSVFVSADSIASASQVQFASAVGGDRLSCSSLSALSASTIPSSVSSASNSPSSRPKTPPIEHNSDAPSSSSFSSPPASIIPHRDSPLDSKSEIPSQAFHPVVQDSAPASPSSSSSSAVPQLSLSASPSSSPSPTPAPAPAPIRIFSQITDLPTQWTFEVIKCDPDRSLISRCLRTFQVDLLRRMVRNLARDGKLKKEYPGSKILQIEKSMRESHRLRMVVLGARHRYDLLFKSTFEREMFFQCASLIRLNSKIWVPDFSGYQERINKAAALFPDAAASGSSSENSFMRWISKKPAAPSSSTPAAIHPMASSESVERIKIWTGTWNLGGAVPPENMKSWIPPNVHDIYAITLQESGYGASETEVYAMLESHLGRDYVNVAAISLWEIRLVIFAKREQIPKISNVEGASKATGFMHVCGNKGGIGIGLRFNETNICFIGCHLAARRERVLVRNDTAAEVIDALRIGLRSVDVTASYHHVFWFGDINYRVETDFDDAHNLASNGKLQELLAIDQLHAQQRLGLVFSEFQEAKINFLPTYRCDRGVYPRTYTKFKRQNPSFCDRILWRSYPGLNVECTRYDAANDITTSDHTPVFATFEVDTQLPVFSFGAGFHDVCEIVFSDYCISGSREFDPSTVKQPCLFFYAPYLEGVVATQTPSARREGNTLCWSEESLPILHPLVPLQDYVRSQHLIVVLRDGNSDTAETAIGHSIISLTEACNSSSPFPLLLRLYAHGRIIGEVSASIQIRWSAPGAVLHAPNSVDATAPLIIESSMKPASGRHTASSASYLRPASDGHYSSDSPAINKDMSRRQSVIAAVAMFEQKASNKNAASGSNKSPISNNKNSMPHHS